MLHLFSQDEAHRPTESSYFLNGGRDFALLHLPCAGDTRRNPVLASGLRTAQNSALGAVHSILARLRNLRPRVRTCWSAMTRGATRDGCRDRHRSRPNPLALTAVPARSQAGRLHVAAQGGYTLGIDDNPPHAIVSGAAVSFGMSNHRRVGVECADMFGPYETFG